MAWDERTYERTYGILALVMLVFLGPSDFPATAKNVIRTTYLYLCRVQTKRPLSNLIFATYSFSQLISLHILLYF